MMDLKGKVALVTGARCGIGAATAHALAQTGATMWTAQRRPADFRDIEADFADPDAPARVVAAVTFAKVRRDILVNKAGLMRQGSVETGALRDWHDRIAVNLTEPFLLIRHALPRVRAVSGAIVNVGSIEGLGSTPGHAGCCAAKAGLHGLTRAVAVDHDPDGVRCNAIAPGGIDTDLTEDCVTSLPEPATFRDRIGAIHPLRRIGDPAGVARLICWLASLAAGFVTGQVIAVDGRRTTQLSLS